MIVAIEKLYSFRDNWHQDEGVNQIVRQYQKVLTLFLEANSEFEPCAVYCKHCGIRFLTDPRNVSRTNLSCPFGCRKHHKRLLANRRSAAYYRTDEGKLNKKRRNAARCVPASCSVDGQPEEEPAAEIDSADASVINEIPVTDDGCVEARLPKERSPALETRLDDIGMYESYLTTSPMFPYLQMLACVLEGVKLSRSELIAVLRQAMRQHSMADRKEVDYVLRFLHQNPP